MSWLRLESATVAADLAEGLEARVADPLWMLARQWQTGEFKGDDAANPLLMEVEATSVRLQQLTLPGGHTVDLTASDTPLETLVEREPIRAGPAAARVTTDLGRLLVRALRRAQAPDPFLDELRDRFRVQLPPDDGLDPAGRRRLELAARASVDGVRLASAIAADPALLTGIFDGIGAPDQARRRMGLVVDAWLAAMAEAFSEPAPTSAWNPQRLEYGFELAGTGPDGGPVRLTSGEGYTGGRLDWFSFDRAASRAQEDRPVTPIVRRAEVLPAPLRFRGMPAARFWAFEDGDVYFGGIEAAPQDLARVAVAGYGTVYGDDWFMLPIRLPVGTLTEITAVTVHDDFGRSTDVSAAAVVDGGARDRAFKFFELTGDPNPARRRAPLLFLPPTVETADAGDPLEDVSFLRDEPANVAWAVEARIESATGRPVDLAARTGPGAPPDADGADGRWRLVLSTPVPDHWVPLVPVRLTEEAGSGVPDGTIMFQRGRVPVPTEPGATRGARGRILVPRQRLLIHEEEIPRSGVRVVRRYESARDAAGRLHTWVGRRKGAGRGAGDSGLRFDVLEQVPEQPEP